jgi:hypothetical protein
VKRRDLLKKIGSKAKAKSLTVEMTEGGSHTKVKIGAKQTVVPRHAEINEITAKAILDQLGL